MQIDSLAPQRQHQVTLTGTPASAAARTAASTPGVSCCWLLSSVPSTSLAMILIGGTLLLLLPLPLVLLLLPLVLLLLLALCWRGPLCISDRLAHAAALLCAVG